jgi:CRP/FNR family cyclic AMP-dependent transcriptional regulator
VNPDPMAAAKARTSPFRVDFWEALPASAAQALRRKGNVRQHPDGALLMQRGQTVTGMLVLQRGRLRAVTGGANGEEHLIRWVEPGEAVGVASVLTELPFQTDLIASGDSQTLWIAREAVLEVLRSDAEAGIAVSRFLGARLSEALELVAAQSQLRLDDRLQAALNHFAQQNGEALLQGGVRLRLTQEDLARAVGASRQRVNQALMRLQTQGRVELGYRRIVVRR